MRGSDLPTKLLNKLESLGVDDRLMDAPENDMFFIWIHKPFLVLERLRIGFEVDEIAVTIDTPEDRIHNGAFPVVWILLPFTIIAVIAPGFPVIGIVQDLSFAKYAGDCFGALTFKPHAIDLSDDYNGFRFNDLSLWTCGIP